MKPGDLTEAVTAVLAAVEAAEGRLAPKKRAVIEAALLCFAESGYAATSTKAISRRAGVAEATIFRHFGTKADLLLRLVRPVAARLIQPGLVEAQEIFAETEGNLEAKIARMMTARLAFADRYAPLVRILLQELPVNPELRGLLQDSVIGGLIRFLDIALGEEIAQGRLRPIPAPRFLRILASMLIGYWIARSMVAPGEWDDEAEIALMAGLLARGLKP